MIDWSAFATITDSMSWLTGQPLLRLADQLLLQWQITCAYRQYALIGWSAFATTVDFMCVQSAWRDWLVSLCYTDRLHVLTDGMSWLVFQRLPGTMADYMCLQTACLDWLVSLCYNDRLPVLWDNMSWLASQPLLQWQITRALRQHVLIGWSTFATMTDYPCFETTCLDWLVNICLLK